MKKIKDYRIRWFLELTLLLFILLLTACKSHAGGQENIEAKEDKIGVTESGELDDQVETEEENSIEKVESTYSGFYYEQLSENEKNVYHEILEGCEQFENRISLSSCNIDELQKAETALNCEHPEFFWINSFSYEYIGDVIKSIQFDVPDQAEQISIQLESIADEITSGISGSEYEKVKAIYEYIINYTDYNLEAEYNQDIRSVLLNQESVCAGYAKTFEYLCQKLEIPCTYILGSVNGGAHAWNLIYIQNQYYWVDVTWGDPVFLNNPDRKTLNYDYLCVSDSDISDHIPETGIQSGNYQKEHVFDLPECPDNSLSYYRLQGSFFTEYDPVEVQNYLVKNIDAGNASEIDMKFATNEAYQEALDDLFKEENVFEMVKDALDSQSVQCSYSYNNSTYLINVTFSTE